MTHDTLHMAKTTIRMSASRTEIVQLISPSALKTTQRTSKDIQYSSQPIKNSFKGPTNQ